MYSQQGDFEVGGGFSYNTFALDELNEHLWQRNYYLNYDRFSAEPYQNLKSFDSEVGYFLQARYWLTDNLAIGGEVEKFNLLTDYKLNYTNLQYLESYELELTGVLGIIDYQLEQEGSKLVLRLALGYYSSLFAWQKYIKFYDDPEGNYAEDNTTGIYQGGTLGGKLGTELFFPVMTGIDGRVGLNYRHVFFEQLVEKGQPFYSEYGDDMAGDEFDFSGLELRGGLDIKF